MLYDPHPTNKVVLYLQENTVKQYCDNLAYNWQDEPNKGDDKQCFFVWWRSLENEKNIL